MKTTENEFKTNIETSIQKEINEASRIFGYEKKLIIKTAKEIVKENNQELEAIHISLAITKLEKQRSDIQLKIKENIKRVESIPYETHLKNYENAISELTKETTVEGLNKLYSEIVNKQEFIDIPVNLQIDLADETDELEQKLINPTKERYYTLFDETGYIVRDSHDNNKIVFKGKHVNGNDAKKWAYEHNNKIV